MPVVVVVGGLAGGYTLRDPPTAKVQYPLRLPVVQEEVEGPDVASLTCR